MITEGLKVLVVGGGGREHALCWKLAQSPCISEVHVAPGNAGTAAEPKARNVAIASEDLTGLLRFAVSNRIDLTVVGPEGPLCAGIVDDFEAVGLPCLGPRRAGAALEGSKSYAKGFMRRYAIPTAAGEGFSDLDAARAYIAGHDLPLVVKADGLCAGKGVVIAHTRGEALAAAEAMLSGEAFGAAGRRIVIEAFLDGEEASFIALCDGREALPLQSSRTTRRSGTAMGPQYRGHGRLLPGPGARPRGP